MPYKTICDIYELTTNDEMIVNKKEEDKKEVVYMELYIKEPKDRYILQQKIKKIFGILDDYYIRIENNIFSIDGKWLLKQKGLGKNKKLETISSVLEIKDCNENLKSEVRKTVENFEGRMDVEIKKFLYATFVSSSSHDEKPCISLYYISVFENGTQSDLEQWKKYGFDWYDIQKLDRTQLESHTDYTYGKMRQNGKEIQNILKQYKKFNQADFEKYFFYGMENREILLEGIIYYINKDLTSKYLELKEEERFLSTEEKLKLWKKKAITSCEQLYRFINIVEGEDSRFDLRLTDEEKEYVKQKVEEVIQRYIEENMLLIFRRGIFYKDRMDEKEENKGQIFGSKRGYNWTQEVYHILQQLNFMEMLDYNQYYSKWLQAKFSRLKISNKYSEEDLKKLEEVYEKYCEDKKKKKEENKGRE